MFGCRALYHEGWKAVSFHHRGQSYEKDEWELFRLDDDFSECRDLARQHPEMLQRLAAGTEAHYVLTHRAGNRDPGGFLFRGLLLNAAKGAGQMSGAQRKPPFAISSDQRPERIRRRRELDFEPAEAEARYWKQNEAGKWVQGP